MRSPKRLKDTGRGSSSTVEDVPAPLDAKQLDACVAGCAQRHQRLLEVVDSLTPEQFAGASSLPGWSRLTVVGHLALNAQSHVHLLECAARGEVGEQYPGGPTARQQAIDDASQWEPEVAVRTLRVGARLGIVQQQCRERIRAAQWTAQRIGASRRARRMQSCASDHAALGRGSGCAH